MLAYLPNIIRHVLTIAGGASFMSDDQLTQAAGIIASIAALGWSIYKTRSAKD